MVKNTTTQLCCGEPPVRAKLYNYAGLQREPFFVPNPKNFFGASRLLLRPLVGRFDPAQRDAWLKTKNAIFTHFCQF